MICYSRAFRAKHKIAIPVPVPALPLAGKAGGRRERRVVVP